MKICQFFTKFTSNNKTSESSHFNTQSSNLQNVNAVNASTKIEPKEYTALQIRNTLRRWRSSITLTKTGDPFTNRIIISSDSDRWIIHNGAKVLAQDHHIPEDNKFSLKSALVSEKELKKHPIFGRSITDLINNGCKPLSEVNEYSRIDLVGHGYEYESGKRHNFEAIEAKELAQSLSDYGLKKVGVLKIQACNIGKGKENSFLDHFRDELEKKNIKVGYICGPKMTIADTRMIITLLGKTFKVKPAFLYPDKSVFPFDSNVLIFLPESLGLRVVRGSLDVEFAGTRYMKNLYPEFKPLEKMSEVTSVNLVEDDRKGVTKAATL